MITLQVPALGSEILVHRDWTFDLHFEERNITLMDHFGIPWPSTGSGYNQWCWFKQGHPPHKVTLPAGTRMRVERIYIRKGGRDFDSLTFAVTEINGSKPKRLRFWTKLDDVNSGCLSLVTQ